jgi:molybdopterin synthase catalytic subunit
MREEARSPKSGAIVVFEGCARDNHLGQSVLDLSYEAYEAMALAMLENIRQEAIEKFSLNSCLIHHRVGVVLPTECALAIICASEHRAESLQAAAWLLDEIKERVPIWKRERYTNDEYSWVEAK